MISIGIILLGYIIGFCYRSRFSSRFSSFSSSSFSRLPIKRGDLTCVFTDYMFRPEQQEVQIFGKVINPTLGHIIPYYKKVIMTPNVETHLKNHYPINIPFNCTVDDQCKTFKMLSIPPGLALLKYHHICKTFLLAFLAFSLISSFCFVPYFDRYADQNDLRSDQNDLRSHHFLRYEKKPNYGFIYLSFIIIAMYLIHSYNQYLITNSPEFTFQFFAKGKLFDL